MQYTRWFFIVTLAAVASARVIRKKEIYENNVFDNEEYMRYVQPYFSYQSPYFMYVQASDAFIVRNRAESPPVLPLLRSGKPCIHKPVTTDEPEIETDDPLSDWIENEVPDELPVEEEISAQPALEAPHSDSKPELEPEIKPDQEPEIIPVPELELKPEPDSVVESDSEPEESSVSELEENPEPEPEEKPELEVEEHPESEANEKPGLELVEKPAKPCIHHRKY